MGSIISAILVSILTSLGWRSLILSVGVDLLRYIANKTKNELAHNLINDLVKALQAEEDAAPK